MDERTEPALPASLVNGRLEGLSVPDLLWNLCRRRSTGVLHLTSRGITKRVYFDGGRIVFALSGDPDERLGDMLLREGLITLDQFEIALSQLSTGKRLGTLLVGAGHLSPDNLVRGVLNQVKGIVLALFPWEEGEYSFVEGPLPTDEVITLGMRTAEILLQGIRQIRSFARIRKSVGPPSTRYQLAPGWHDVVDGLDIRDGERMLLKRLDEAGVRGTSVDAMCREVFLSNYEIYQALWAFLVLGVVEAVGGAEDARPGAAIEGRVERTNLAEMLVRLSRDESTGVLYMSRGTLERTLHIREGTCIFATSNSIDDGLVNHLLRRGVISLADREETARRLLSNKRVGTILLEMGVIDEVDLHATVREQLSEVIFDTFRWDAGDFCFLRGELPTVEEITLHRTVEDLVFAGVRRITSWLRVREGCGGLGARLVLLPRYLAVLDKMTVGPEEWELISLLKTPKTVLEVCREGVLGHFRSCQILWALRLLGAVGEAPVEVSVDTALGTLDAVPRSEPATIAAAPAVPDAVTPEPEPVRLEAAAEEAGPSAEAEADREPEASVEPEASFETETNDEPEAVAAPEPDPIPLPVSEMDSTAEVISENWRLSQPPPPEDATVAIAREDLEVARHGHDEHVEPVEPELADAELPPRFELGDPGTGLSDINVDETKIDLRPDAVPVVQEPVVSDDIAPVVQDDAVPVVPDEAPPEGHTFELDHTARISREDLEAALKDTPAEPRLSPFVPPANLDGAVASFNARHVVLFRALRAEIGAGAANFVRNCRGSLDNGFAAMFESAELRADGSWDPEGLKRAIIEHRVANASDGFRRLLEDELQRLRAHLGEARARALAHQLATIP